MLRSEALHEKSALHEKNIGPAQPPLPLHQRDCWIFDMDGTLTLAAHDFEAIREELGLPVGQPILESLSKLPEAEAAPLHAKLHEIEMDIARSAKAQPGAVELLERLQAQNKRIGVLTRNSKPGADETLAACNLARFFEPDAILSRHCCPPKPEPDGIQQLLRQWEAPASRAVMVGDYVFDLLAGRNAGTATVHIDVNGEFPWPEHTDAKVTSLTELIAIAA